MKWPLACLEKQFLKQNFLIVLLHFLNVARFKFQT